MENVNENEEHPDYVNHPPHYTRDGAIECIDEMVMFYGKEVVAAYCLCNVMKYRYRSSDKNGEQDILKSDWYARKYQELTGGKLTVYDIAERLSKIFE